MWSSILRAARNLGFTKGETTAILFLAVATLTGGVLRAVSPQASAEETLAGKWRVHDSTFAARSSSPVEDARGPINTSASAASLSEEGGMGAGDAKQDPEARPSPGSRGGGGGSSFAQLGTRVVNINTADAATLESLPGVGPSTARYIIEYRKDSGPFRRIEDIMNVKSIGEKKFEKMRAYLKVSE